MNVFLMCLLATAGLVLIVKGGDLFVESSVSIARIFHINEMIIGATIVSIGTTLPELLTSIIATIKGVALGGDEGYYSLALANAIGSMLANSGLILAIVMLVRPPRYDKDIFNRPSIYVLLISVFLVFACYTNSRLSLVEGIVLVLLFLLFATSNIKHAREESLMTNTLVESEDIQHESRTRIALSFIIGGLSISIGAVLLVDNARALAVSMGVSEQLLGVTLVAIGTSLPELVTSLTALRHGNLDIGVGNILGAHVINGTLILGLISILAGGIYVDSITRYLSIFVMMGIMLFLVLPTLVRRRFSRVQGLSMLLLYLIYMSINIYLTLNAQIYR